MTCRHTRRVVPLADYREPLPSPLEVMDWPWRWILTGWLLACLLGSLIGWGTGYMDGVAMTHDNTSRVLAARVGVR